MGEKYEYSNLYFGVRSKEVIAYLYATHVIPSMEKDKFLYIDQAIYYDLIFNGLTYHEGYPISRDILHPTIIPL